ncbi:MAG: hypothetical protein CFE29_17905 [Bradyrhizobiaceae bacterium PARB1]|jgi:hypothetical protein|nr:MAG: hypothetical protein CFE29_17905 [Bradyrhizobiaceae bacterium PARB1]
MKKSEYEGWLHAIGQIEIPADGLSLDRFARAMNILSMKADHAAIYLHRGKHLFRSQQNGHIRVFPFSHSTGRGRPRKHRAHASSLMPAQIIALLVDITPVAGSVAVLLARMPKGGWQDEPTRQAEIRRSIEVEARSMASMFRGFVERAGFPVKMVRSYLWMTFSANVMSAVAEIEPDLANGDAPLTETAPVTPKKIKANLPPHECIHTYVEAAGPFGIGAYEIASATRGRIKREEVIQIAEELASSGFLYIAEARASSRGPKGIRLYAMKHGKPEIGSDGRRLPQYTTAL